MKENIETWKPYEQNARRNEGTQNKDVKAKARFCLNKSTNIYNQNHVRGWTQTNNKNQLVNII